MLSMIKNSLTVADGANPITKHFRMVRQTSCAGPEMVWKIFDAIRLSDGKVALLWHITLHYITLEVFIVHDLSEVTSRFAMATQLQRNVRV